MKRRKGESTSCNKIEGVAEKSGRTCSSPPKNLHGVDRGVGVHGGQRIAYGPPTPPCQIGSDMHVRPTRQLVRSPERGGSGSWRATRRVRPWGDPRGRWGPLSPKPSGLVCSGLVQRPAALPDMVEIATDRGRCGSVGWRHRLVRTFFHRKPICDSYSMKPFDGDRWDWMTPSMENHRDRCGHPQLTTRVYARSGGS